MIGKIISSVWSDISGQDLIEYALMAGFVGAAAGAIIPGFAAAMITACQIPTNKDGIVYARFLLILAAIIFLNIIIFRREKMSKK